MKHFLCRDQRQREGRGDGAGTEDGAGLLLLGETGGVAEGAVLLGPSPSGAIQSDPHAGSNRNKQSGVFIYFFCPFLEV